MKYKSLFYFGYFIFFLTLILGGLGIQRSLVTTLAIISSSALLFCVKSVNPKLIFPKGFFLYIIFLILLAINLNRSFDPSETLEFIKIYLSGGIIWLAVYNSAKEFENLFGSFIVLFGLLFGFLYLLNILLGFPFRNSFSLFSSTTFTHNNIGNLWAVILVYLAAKPFNFGKSGKKRLLFILGSFFVFISLTRSAYISLIAGLLFILHKNKNISRKINLFFFAGIGLIAGLFILSSVVKSPVYSRGIYIAKSFESLVENPFGVGVGSFGYLYLDNISESGFIERGVYSSYTHNIILEFLVGMGLSAMIFIFWLARVLYGIINIKSDSDLPYSAAFLALTANFMTDYTYVVLTFVWMWFTLLGFAGKSKNVLHH